MALIITVHTNSPWLKGLMFAPALVAMGLLLHDDWNKMAEGPEAGSAVPMRRSLLLSKRLLSILCFLGLWALAQLGQRLHFGKWLDSLPFEYQIAAKIAFVLLFVVGPFAVFLFILSRRKDA